MLDGVGNSVSERGTDGKNWVGETWAGESQMERNGRETDGKKWMTERKMETDEWLMKEGKAE